MHRESHSSTLEHFVSQFGNVRKASAHANCSCREIYRAFGFDYGGMNIYAAGQMESSHRENKRGIKLLFQLRGQ